MASIIERFKMAIKAFREAYVTSNTLDTTNWSDFGARQVRYDLLWSMYENTQFRNIHSWAQAYRNQYGLYRWIRNIYNPTYRLGDIWTTFVWGGMLNLDALPVGAIPIETKNEALRAAIAQAWKWSNWSVNKDICSLRGAVLGDTAIYIRDDTERQQVRLEVLHPSVIKSITVDSMGQVKAYEIEESRDIDGRATTYLETAGRGAGETVIFKTYANGKEYAWDDNPGSEWSVPWGFIPLVVIQHNNVGLDWGWSELHPGRSKFNELDDQASLLHDQVRKTVNAPWMFKGVKQPSTNPTVTGALPTTDKPQPSREEVPALYADATANAQALVMPLDIASVTDIIQRIIQEIERDYPELQQNIWSMGDGSIASGRALEIARQPIEAKARKRRGNYDACLVRAHQMAVAIGGWHGYDGFAGFGLDSYAAGALDHRIADRPVFPVGELGKIEVKQAFWTALALAADQIGIEAALHDFGLTDEAIAELTQRQYANIQEQ